MVRPLEEIIAKARSFQSTANANHWHRTATIAVFSRDG